jgi:tetratricopeptide (TPR) repeat protein
MPENASPYPKCPECGRELPLGQSCEHCKQQITLRLLFQRETVLLLVLALLAVVVYLGTRKFADSNHRMQVALATAWYKQGQQRMRAGDPDNAVAAFREANVNDHNNRLYVRALASALESDNRNAEAQELLLEVRENSPEDPEINLELARIAAKQSNVNEALRYYHNTLYGIWTGDNIDFKRQQVRRELIHFLLDRGVKDQALAEIIALGAHLPDTQAALVEVGRLYLQAGDPARALASFKKAYLHDRQNPLAMEGAGEAAFQANDFAQARHFLSELVAPDAPAKEMLNIATLVQENNPLISQLSYVERERRIQEDVRYVLDRLKTCLANQAPPQNADTLQSLQDKLNAQKQSLVSRRVKNAPELTIATLELISQAENGISQPCGPMNDHDKALLLIAQKARNIEQ